MSHVKGQGAGDRLDMMPVARGLWRKDRTVLAGVKHPFRSALDHRGGGHEVLG